MISEDGADVVLEVEGLTVTYGEQRAVDNAHLKVMRGQLFGFIGPNGAGKSTTMKILAGYLLETLGHERFLELYRSLSGWSGELAGQDTYEIQAEIVPRLGIAKGTLGEAVMAYSKTLGGGGIEPGSDGDEGTRVELEGLGLKTVIITTGSWVTFDIQSDMGEPAGALMLAGEEGGPGHLFEDHFPGKEYQGERGAVIFNGGEVGFYDFTIDTLTAKYVYGFRPDPSYLTGQGRRLQFRILRSLLPSGVISWILEDRDG